MNIAFRKLLKNELTESFGRRGPILYSTFLSKYDCFYEFETFVKTFKNDENFSDLYEIFKLFNFNFCNSNCFDDVYNASKVAIKSNEAGYRTERIFFGKIKNILNKDRVELVGVLSENELEDAVLLKTSFIVSRNLFYIKVDDKELDYVNQVELFKLINNMWLDIKKWFLFKLITDSSAFSKQKINNLGAKDVLVKEEIDIRALIIEVDSWESSAKSYFSRVVITLAYTQDLEKNHNNNNLEKKDIVEMGEGYKLLKTVGHKETGIKISLQRVGSKTIRFLKTTYSTNLFFHFYANISFKPAELIFNQYIGLNGGSHYLLKELLIEKNIYNKEYLKIDSALISFTMKQNKLAFLIDEEMVLDNNLQRHIDESKKLGNLAKLWKLNPNNDANREGGGDLLSSVTFLKRLQKKPKGYFVTNNKKELEKVEKRLLDLKKNSFTFKKLNHKLTVLKEQIGKGRLVYNPWVKELQLIQKRYALIFLIELFEKMKEFNKNLGNHEIYFTLFYDFRGRFYYTSMISPDKGWPFRFIYHYNRIDRADKIPKPNNTTLINKFNYINELKIIKEVTKVEYTEPDEIAILWTLVSIGKIFMEKKEKFNEKEFIVKGLEAFLKKTCLKDRVEDSEVNYYYKLITSIGTNNYKERYLMKDVSASIFQNAVKILWIRNAEVLNLLNLNGRSVWYDPYFPIIKKSVEVVPENFKLFFNRKTLKKPIMTYYYGCELTTSWKYFIEEVLKIEKIDSNTIIELKTVFKDVYLNFKNLDKETYFEYSMSDLIQTLDEKKIQYIEFPDFKFSRYYWKLKNKRVDIKVFSKRYTITANTDVNNEKKPMLNKNKNACAPNILHGLDAYFARKVIKGSGNIFSIHDAFAVNPYNMDNFIINANQFFEINEKFTFSISNARYKGKIFSKFIIS